MKKLYQLLFITEVSSGLILFGLGLFEYSDHNYSTSHYLYAASLFSIVLALINLLTIHRIKD